MERRVLVVDDEARVLDAFRKHLERSGIEVAVAGSAAEALEVLHHENIQVMFLDLNMPGMNGVALCETIRERNSVAIIHAVTGYSSLFELSDCREAGFDDYFTKPVRMEALLAAAEESFQKLERWTRR